MQVSGGFAGELIRQGQQGLAALTAERLLSKHPEIIGRYQPNPMIKWRESLASRLGYLAAAVAMERPGLFAAQAAWAKIATAARGGDLAVRDLHAALGCLRETLAHEMPEEARPLVLACVDAALRTLEHAPLEAPAELSVQTPRGKLAADYLLAILEGDRQRACRLVLEEVEAKRLSVREAYIDVIQPVQAELGRMWHMNESTVAEEHFCTATTKMLMSQLYPHMSRRPRNGKTAVCASVESNAHDMGVRMIADFLEMDGWKSVYLGPSVPPDDLALAVADFGADLLCLSAGIAPQLPIVEQSIKSVRAGPMQVPHACNTRVRVLVGGGAFRCVGSREEAEKVARRLGADGFACGIDDAVVLAARLCGVE